MIDVPDEFYVLVKEEGILILVVNLRAFGFLLDGNVRENSRSIRSHTNWWLGFYFSFLTATQI